MRDNAKFEVIESHATEAEGSVLSDETITYTSLRASKQTLISVRRIVFRDETLNAQPSPPSPGLIMQVSK